MELTVKLEDNADISLLKKILLQIKGIKSVDIAELGKKYSWKETENHEDFGNVMEQSDNDYKEGKHQELIDDFLDKIFDES